LVVDDEPDFAALLQSILVSAGYTVTTACNCDDALKQVCKARPDVITLDIRMPRKSGVFFYRKLKEDARFRDVPVVVVTGTMHQDKEMDKIVLGLLEGPGVPPPEAYVEKPVDWPSLLKTLERTISPGGAASR
jgi:CheY-like chemotaxis protein